MAGAIRKIAKRDERHPTGRVARRGRAEGPAAGGCGGQPATRILRNESAHFPYPAVGSPPPSRRSESRCGAFAHHSRRAVLADEDEDEGGGGGGGGASQTEGTHATRRFRLRQFHAAIRIHSAAAAAAASHPRRGAALPQITARAAAKFHARSSTFFFSTIEWRSPKFSRPRKFHPFSFRPRVRGYE